MKKFLFGILGLLFAVPAVAATLPAGYTELEYIESTGTQLIDLGLKWTYGTSTKTVCEMLDREGTALGVVGARNSAKVVWGSFSNNTNANYTCYGNVVNITFSQNMVDGNYHTWETNNNGFYLDGEQKTNLSGSDQTLVSADNIGLFGRYDGAGNIERCGKWRIKSHQTNVDNTLAQNLIPARRTSDNVVGMYDTVSGNFFTNAGTGEFIAGPVVNSCRNLANITENTITLGMYTASDGTVVTTDNFSFQSDFIPVSPNTTYTISANEGMTMIRVVEYDAGGNFIRRNATATSSNASKLTFTTGANTAKVTIGANQSVNNLTAAQVLAANWQLELGSTATEYVPYCANAIKIATTAYNSARFNPVVTELNDTIATIRDVVTNTINQTAAIADLQATKQTRPDEQCPAGKKCLLVEDNDGMPHWYEIVESPEVQ